MPTKNWPHPVLDVQSGDYPNCAFQARFEVRQTKLEYKVHAEFDLGCDSLESSIGDGEATYLVQVSCARTAFREAFPTSSGALDISIPEHELRDAFLLSPYIVSKTTFALESEELAPTFEGLTFTVRAGAVLAAAQPVEYVAEKAFDELKNISAIFEVVKHLDKDNNAVEYDLNRKKIGIFLPHKVYEEYRLFRSRTPYREMFVCSLVLPGLAAALESLLAEGDFGDAQRWKRVLSRRLNEIGRTEYTSDQTFKVAQELLEFPFGRAFQAIRTKESTES
jgi:hypothetical protein